MFTLIPMEYEKDQCNEVACGSVGVVDKVK